MRKSKKCEKAWEMWEKSEKCEKRGKSVRKSEKSVRKSEMCEEKVRDVCEKLRGMGKSEIWDNRREKFDMCEKKLEVLKKLDVWEKVHTSLFAWVTLYAQRGQAYSPDSMDSLISLIWPNLAEILACAFWEKSKKVEKS